VPPAPFAHRHAHRLEWFRRTGTRQSDPILDVGCGDGRLLWWLHRAGFDDLTGIDAFLRSASPGRDASPRFERRALEEHEGRYRLVMAHHSFEHMRDPRRAFAAFGRLVSEEGWLVLRVPNAEGWARRHYGADWVQLDAPRHLHLHTRRSIEALAGREGFRVVGIVDDSGPFQIWGSELYRRGISLEGGGRGGRRALSLRERVSARRRAAALRAQGLGDQACFYLQRSDRLSSGAEGSTHELRALPKG
jgi:SAM-dependent methyltransferase